MKDKQFNEKITIFNYLFVVILFLSVIVMFVISLKYPIDFLNILDIKNPIMKTYWQSLVIVAPINLVIKNYFDKHFSK